MSTSQVTTRNPAYLKTENGQKRSIHSNVLICLRTHDSWAGRLVYNQLTKRKVVRGCPWDPTIRAWTDEDDVMLVDWLARYEGVFLSSPKVAGQCVDAICRENSYNPVTEYLQALDWDGEERLNSWLENYLGCPVNEAQSHQYLCEVSRCVLISAVARAFRPGCKVDTCMILEGQQGIGKSSAVAILGGDWYTDDLKDIMSKDACLQAQTWIIELSELDSLSRSEASHVKAFISRQVDRFRPPYRKHLEEFPRPGIFIGTVNLSEYLKDETGARRFWPVETGAIHLEWLAEDRDQLWAEAAARYMAGESWWFDAAMRAELAAPMETRKRVADPWEDEVLNFATAHITNGAHYVALRDIVTIALDIKTANRDQRVDSRVASILRSHGWVRKRFRIPAGFAWGYTRPE